MPSKSLNRNLNAAKATKQDEFYTQLSDIEKELRHYTAHFKGKTVLCNCDDPKISNFFHFFSHNFEKLGLKKLVTTSYDGSPIAGAQLTFGEYEEGNDRREKPKAIAVEIEEVKDLSGDGATGIEDGKLSHNIMLKGKTLRRIPKKRSVLFISPIKQSSCFRQEFFLI